MGLEPTSLSTGGFQNRFLTNSGDLRSYSRSTGDRNRTCGLLVQSQTQLPTVATPGRMRTSTAQLRQARGRGFEPLSPDSKSGSLPLADPRIVGECHAGIEPAYPAWKAGAFADRPMAHVSYKRKERESNSQGSVSARPLSRRLPSPIGLPFQSFLSSGGRNRTCTHPLNRRLPYRLATPECFCEAESGRSDLNRRSRGSGPRGIPDFPTS